jgi:predicted nuclease of restriction endonuclease-like (RecB) superfamily
MSNNRQPQNPLFQEIRQLIDAAKQRAAIAINAEITLLYQTQRPTPDLLRKDPYLLDFLNLNDSLTGRQSRTLPRKRPRRRNPPRHRTIPP